MENLAIARVLNEIADLLELKAENPFKIRAYRSGADIAAESGERLAAMDEAQLRAIPGIGKDLAARIIEIAATGTCAYHAELLKEFPPTILDLLRLQGVGPKTVALLYKSLNISSLEELEAAATSGALRGIKGMGAKKEQLMLKAIAERKQHAGRHLLADAAAVAEAIIAYLRNPVAEGAAEGTAAAPAAAAAPSTEPGPGSGSGSEPARGNGSAPASGATAAAGVANAAASAYCGDSAGVSFDVVGSLRRGVETTGDIDILACGAAPDLMSTFTNYRLVERVLGRGETKSSVLLWKGFQADLRLVPPQSRGAAMQYFTGSKAHNIALRNRALTMGMTLNEYGLFRLVDGEGGEQVAGEQIAGETEEGLYEALGLAWIEPELRENRGEIAAAEARTLPRLVTRADIRGDLHMHTTETDGKDDIESMALAARAAGHEYIAITDHSQSLAMANGLDEARALKHAERIREIGARIEGITLLAGIECDIRPDGTMDLADDCLAQLDIVIASVHSAFQQEPAQMTERMLRAVSNPYVDVIGHPTGRLILRREPYKVDVEALIAAAATAGVAIEINSQIDRLDLSDAHARLAHQRGVPLVISSDAHSQRALDVLRWGIVTARRAWLEPADILNTRPLTELRQSLRRHRTRG
jgi:DNA polymerase (family 10)